MQLTTATVWWPHSMKKHWNCYRWSLRELSNSNSFEWSSTENVIADDCERFHSWPSQMKNYRSSHCYSQCSCQMWVTDEVRGLTYAYVRYSHVVWRNFWTQMSCWETLFFHCWWSTCWLATKLFKCTCAIVEISVAWKLKTNSMEDARLLRSTTSRNFQLCQYILSHCIVFSVMCD